MKKFYTLLLSFLLMSCSHSEFNDDIKMVCPTGAPSLAFYSQATNTNFETNGTPKNIIAMMNDSSDKDIVVIDAISGINAINKGVKYKLASILTFGNFYLVGTGNDDNNHLDSTDKIVLFGKDQTPDKLFHYIYGNLFDKSIEYVDGVADAGATLIGGKNPYTGSEIRYVFIAEPVYSNVANNPNAKTYGKTSIYANIQELFKEKSGNKELIQAGLFVKDKDDKEYNQKIKNHLLALEESINDAIANPSIVNDKLSNISEDKVKALFGINSNIISKVLENNSVGLGYKKAIKIKDSIDNFIELFDSTGIGSTDEKIYFK